MACGAIINANNAGLPEDLGVTLNCRYVYRPPFEVPDVERKFGNLTLTYAAQMHVAVIEIDPETGYYDIVDYAAVDDCGKRINPQIVEGQVMGATAQALGGVMHEQFVYDEDGNLLTPNFYDYHVPHALDMPPLKTGFVESPSPFTRARHEGHGRGRRRRHPRGLRGGAGRAALARRRDRRRQREPVPPVWEMLEHPERDARHGRHGGRMNVSGERTFAAPRQAVWDVLNDPASMAKTMPGVESFDVHDEKRWTANVKIPLGLGGLKMKIDMDKTEEREPEFAKLQIKGQGVGAMLSMETSFELSDAARRHRDALGRRREARRPGRLDGPARAAADRQPAGAARADGARQAGAGGDGERRAPPRKARRTTARPLTRTPSRRSGRFQRCGRGRQPAVAGGVRARARGADDLHGRQGLSAAMAVPFRVGVMQLTMEPLDEMLASARAMDEAGMDTIWLAEAYPWWRKHGMEARSSTGRRSADGARDGAADDRLGDHRRRSTRHPVQVAMDARVVQEAAGPGRFILGFGTSKIFLNNTKMQTKKTLGPMRDAVTIVRGVLGGERFEYDGDTWSADVPALQADAHTPREVPPVYVAATAPKMQALAGEIGDGCLTPSITTPAFVRYTRENVNADIDIGCTVVASIHATDRDQGRDGAREIAGMYLANKVQNIQGSADTLLDLAGLEQDEIRPVAEAMERGGRLAAKEQVTDAILDKCKPIAGTPDDCIAAIEEYKDAGCTHVMLELWGEDRHEQIRLFGEQVLPHVRG